MQRRHHTSRQDKGLQSLHEGTALGGSPSPGLVHPRIAPKAAMQPDVVASAT